MIIEKIAITNFRNQQSKEIVFDKGINIICGPNAIGKTSVVEAVSMLAFGKSIRATQNKDVIKWQEQETHIRGFVKKTKQNVQIDMHITDKNQKSVVVNGKKIPQIGDLLGNFNVVYFSPEEIKIIKDAPSERRRFLDMSISQYNKKYLTSLISYNKSLAQRNKAIKASHYQDEALGVIELWDEVLAKEGAYIIKERLDFIEKIKEPLKKAQSLISQEKEQIDIVYQTQVKHREIEEIEKELMQKLKKNLKKDFEAKTTSVGAHRDDFCVYIDKDIDIRRFGSQGQQRTATIALKIAECYILEEKTNEKPVLIMDDLFSELDEERCKNIFKAIEDTQIIITTTFVPKEIKGKKIKIH